MSNKCAVLIVGIDQWEKYTSPLIDSISMYEPTVQIVVVDNASTTPYPLTGEVVRSETRLSYAAAINLAAENTDADWLLSINNDTICTAPFMHLLDGLKDTSYYARQIIQEGRLVWFGNWIVLIPRKVWNEVGPFDPAFQMCGFEDADYAARALKYDFKVEWLDLPFTHFWGKTRWCIPNYPEIRENNIRYFKLKHGYKLGDSMVVLRD